MNHESVKARIERKRKSQQQTLVVIVFFTLVLGGWLWYHFIYIRTPDYALKSLRTAITERDAETADRWLALDSIIGSAYDDLASDILRYDSELTDETRRKYTSFYAKIKPKLTTGIKSYILHYAGNGEWPPLEGTELTNGRMLGIDFEQFLERSKLRSAQIAGEPAVRHIGGQTAVGDVLIRDSLTQHTFTLRFTMKQQKDGHWQITKLENYSLYLDEVMPLHNRDIANYIAATHDIVTFYNGVFAAHRDRFRTLMKAARGNLTGNTAASIKALIQNEVVPILKERQEKLDAVSIPPGAAYLANQRHLSTDLSIEAWKHYLRAITQQSNEEFQAAETLLKQAVETDLRIKDVIRRSAVSQTLPDVP